MADKTIIIIFWGINILMWLSVADWMRKTSRKSMEFIKKSDEYQHKTFIMNKELTEMNINSMNEFIQRLSAIMETKANNDYEAENRK